MIKSFYKSLATYVNHRWGPYIFPLFFCIEAVLYMPANVILTLFCIEQRDYAYWYAIVATIGSTIGATIAYYLGGLIFNAVGLRFIEYFSSIETFNYLTSWYHSYQALTVLCATFAPIPFKLITLTAGFCHLPFSTFIIFVFLGRASRFLLIAGLTKTYGPQIIHFTNKYFKYLLISMIGLIVLAFFIFR